MVNYLKKLFLMKLLLIFIMKSDFITMIKELNIKNVLKEDFI